GNPNIFRNNIRNGEQNGVLIWDNGKGVLRDNNIIWNKFAGIEIQSTGNPVVSQNKINANYSEAIRVFDGGIGSIVDNDLRGNRRGAWSIPTKTTPNLKIARNIDI
ncbi:MAG: right-handed parallel beta-helix repeat-containing protein, partial [Methanothrix sp.]|nr:right-handed parallel beta-helix repeat-containing protein [Methanothrix sp.]